MRSVLFIGGPADGQRNTIPEPHPPEWIVVVPDVVVPESAYSLMPRDLPAYTRAYYRKDTIGYSPFVTWDVYVHDSVPKRGMIPLLIARYTAAKRQTNKETP